MSLDSKTGTIDMKLNQVLRRNTIETIETMLKVFYFYVHWYERHITITIDGLNHRSTE